MGENRSPKTVKNKDVILLAEVRYIQMDIVSLENRAQWERGRMQNITQHITSTPGGNGSSGGMDDAIVRIAELEERHRKLSTQYSKLVKKAERIINGIPSHQVRTFCTLLYMDNMADSAVQSVLRMSRWTYDSLKSAVENAESMESVKWSDRYTTE